MSFFNKLKFFKEDITSKLISNEEECDWTINSLIMKRKSELSLILGALSNKPNISDFELPIIKMDTLQKELSQKFPKNFILHLLLLTNFLSKLFEIRNLKYRLTLVSIFAQTFSKMVETNSIIETTVPYKELSTISMGSISALLTIEENKPQNNSEDEILIINNEQ